MGAGFGAWGGWLALLVFGFQTLDKERKPQALRSTARIHNPQTPPTLSSRVHTTCRSPPEPRSNHKNISSFSVFRPEFTYRGKRFVLAVQFFRYLFPKPIGVTSSRFVDPAPGVVVLFQRSHKNYIMATRRIAPNSAYPILHVNIPFLRRCTKDIPLDRTGKPGHMTFVLHLRLGRWLKSDCHVLCVRVNLFKFRLDARQEVLKVLILV